MSEKILTVEDLADIESRLKDWDGGAQYPSSWNNIRALCATVRHLIAENENLKVHVSDRDRKQRA